MERTDKRKDQTNGKSEQMKKDLTNRKIGRMERLNKWKYKTKEKI